MFTKRNNLLRQFGHGGSVMIEAMLSVVILSVGIAVIIQAMTSSLRASAYSTEYTKAVILLENKMYEFLEKGTVSPGKNEEITLSAPNEKYSYLITSQTLDSENTDKLNELDIAIQWRSGKRNNSLNLSTYLFDE